MLAGPFPFACPGPVEGATLCGDRATAPIENIWCEKIRGCSYRDAACSAQRPQCPAAVHHSFGQPRLPKALNH
jgi:hypothetical protein